MPTRNLRYLCSPSHGWLEVDRDLILETGVAGRISAYSRMMTTASNVGRIAFLEEDCDMPMFLKAAKAAGFDINVVMTADPDELTRQYPRFNPSDFGYRRRASVPNSTMWS